MIYIVFLMAFCLGIIALAIYLCQWGNLHSTTEFKPYPTEAFLLISDVCNARCGFCFGHTGAKAEYLNVDSLKVIANHLHFERMNTVILSGGEPLLNPDLMGLVQFLDTYRNLSIGINTNGINLYSYLGQGLIDSGVWLSVSVNAGNREAYKKAMQVDQFDRVVENLSSFQDNNLSTYRMPMPGVQVHLTFAASFLNIDSLPAFVRLAHDLKVSGVRVFYVRFYPEKIRSDMAQGGKMMEDNDSLFFHQELSDIYMKQARAIAQYYNLTFEHDPLFCENLKPQPCTYPFKSILVDTDGLVYPCCGGEAMFRDTTYDFGNALQQSVEGFWDNEAHSHLRQAVQHLDNPSIPECAVCSNILKWKGHVKQAHIMDWDRLKKHD